MSNPEHGSSQAPSPPARPRRHTPRPDPTVVGIGASAGGLVALKTLFSGIRGDTGLAWVVVVHLSPEHESHLDDVLQPHVNMPVQQVRETVPLEPDHVYLIPPNANLESIDTHLRLTRLEQERRYRAPVDHFFRTLSRTHDGHAIGVILTGSGSDGALGVKAITERGGLTVVQDPNQAEFDGMPQSAIATGLVDLVLPVEEIPAAVLRFAQTRPKIALVDREGELSDRNRQLLHKIFAQIRARAGRDFTHYKRSTILRRISRRMQLNDLEELGEYLGLLRAEPEEVRALADDLLITVTSFFRDPAVFDRLGTQILPKIFEGKAADDEVRVWSVGCATGEEAYSLAMLLLEESGRHEVSPRIQVFASDLHEHSLERARNGFYPGDIEADVPPQRLKRFFIKEDGGYRVRKEVRELVIFAHHNLLGDPPFSRLDLLSCRNLLIYLQREAQEDVDELFHYALRSDGYLLIGGSEAIVRSDLFVMEDKSICLYRRRDVPTPEPRLPVFPVPRHHAGVPHGRPEGREHPPSFGEMHQRIVERFAPPSLLVGPEDKVVHLSERAGRYLVHPGGEMTSSVYRLVREELRLELHTALSEARRSGSEVRTTPVPVRFNGEVGPVSLRVQPAPAAAEEGYALVVFEEGRGDEEEPPVVPAPLPAAMSGASASERERELTEEVNRQRQRVQAVIEEYETSQEEMKASNEELQSANEELRSTLEELETSKEELHSMNEELQTMNQENRHKVEELAQLSADLQNLLAATDIAMLFLDRQLRILRFTPAVSKVFNIRSTDRGRPLSDLTHKLGYDDLPADAEQVLGALVPVEREVTDEAGRHYLARVLPYRSAEDRIEGVVITLVDTTEIKRVEEELSDKTRALEVEDQRKDFFLAVLGHELRNPLAALSFAMMLIEEDAQKAEELQPMVAAQVEQLDRLVNDLLEISRIERGRVTLRKAPTDLVRMVRNAAQSVASTVREKEQVLELPDPEDSLSVTADETRLEQVVANLLHNASKYSPEGGRIRLALGREGKEAWIAVHDEGKGLERENLSRIFDSWEQADPVDGGLGIGLTLVKQLVEQHGGRVEVESAGLGEGCTFTVRLPAGDLEGREGEEPLAAAPAPAEEGSAADLEGLRVLVVDDVRETADSLALLLRSRGAEARAAYTGEGALEKVRDWQPRAALVDLALPDTTGYELVRRLRETLDGEVLYLAVTGFGDDGTANKAREAGFAQRLVKPVDFQQLQSLLARHLSGAGEGDGAD